MILAGLNLAKPTDRVSLAQLMVAPIARARRMPNPIHISRMCSACALKGCNCKKTRPESKKWGFFCFIPAGVIYVYDEREYNEA